MTHQSVQADGVGVPADSCASWQVRALKEESEGRG